PGAAPSIAQVYTVLEEFAAFGVPLSITEYDYAHYTNNNTTCVKANEAVAATYMRDFLTMVFSHPAVESFILWDFADGFHWRCDAPIFREDWSLKPSGEAYL